MSEKTEAEAGAKTTAEGLVAAQVTVAKAREKVIKEEAVASAKTTAEGLANALEAAATAAAKAAAKVEVEAKTIATLEAELLVKKAALEKSNSELAETNAKILSGGLHQRGAWSALTAYVPGDLVTFGTASGSFLCLLAATNKTPTEGVSNANWFYRGKAA